MKRLFPILTVCALLCTACHTQEEEATTFNFDNTCWFDGYEFFVGSHDTITNNPDLFIFQGGTLHEGGSTFALLQVATDTFVIKSYPGTEWTAVGVEGDTAVLQQLGEKTIIVCLNPEDDEADTLWMYDPGDKSPMAAYEDILIQTRINTLTGTYYDSIMTPRSSAPTTKAWRTPRRSTSSTRSRCPATYCNYPTMSSSGTKSPLRAWTCSTPNTGRKRTTTCANTASLSSRKCSPMAAE